MEQRDLIHFLRHCLVSTSEGVNVLQNTPSILNALQKNVHAICTVLDRVEALTIPQHGTSIIHIHRRFATPSTSTSVYTSTPASRDAPSFDIVSEVRFLRDIVDEALAQCAYFTRAARGGPRRGTA